jgi:hypothetical protein
MGNAQLEQQHHITILTFMRHAGTSMRGWVVTEEQVQAVIDLLGPPETEGIQSPELLQKVVEGIADGTMDGTVIF